MLLTCAPMSPANQQLAQDNDDEVTIPAMCPAFECRDKIPAVDDSLRNLFRQYGEIIKAKGADSGHCARQEMSICLYIKGALKALEARAHAKKQGWPTDIDFSALPDRIMKFKEDLHRLVFTEGLKSDNLAMAQFKSDVDLQYPNGRGLQKLSNSPITPGGIVDNARPG
jgi:hypothetical protein